MNLDNYTKTGKNVVRKSNVGKYQSEETGLITIGKYDFPSGHLVGEKVHGWPMSTMNID